MSISGIHHVTIPVDDEARAEWFYGEVLGLKLKARPEFKFPGLFYLCGDNEIHLIIAGRPLAKEDLFLRIDHEALITRRYIHRHAALIVSDWAGLRSRLEEHGVEILFGPDSNLENDPLARNMVEGWLKMYGGVPIFCLDPFGNLLELIPNGKLERKRHLS